MPCPSTFEAALAVLRNPEAALALSVPVVIYFRRTRWRRWRWPHAWFRLLYRRPDGTCVELAAELAPAGTDRRIGGRR